MCYALQQTWIKSKFTFIAVKIAFSKNGEWLDEAFTARDVKGPIFPHIALKNYGATVSFSGAPTHLYHSWEVRAMTFTVACSSDASPEGL